MASVMFSGMSIMINVTVPEVTARPSLTSIIMSQVVELRVSKSMSWIIDMTPAKEIKTWHLVSTKKAVGQIIYIETSMLRPPPST